MSKQIHQCIDADIGIGELSGEGVPQSIHKGAARSFAVDARLSEGAQDPVLQGPAGDAATIGADKREFAGQAFNPPVGERGSRLQTAVVGANQFLGAQTGQQCGENDARSRSGQSLRRRGCSHPAAQSAMQ